MRLSKYDTLTSNGVLDVGFAGSSVEGNYLGQIVPHPRKDVDYQWRGGTRGWVDFRMFHGTRAMLKERNVCVSLVLFRPR